MFTCGASYNEYANKVKENTLSSNLEYMNVVCANYVKFYFYMLKKLQSIQQVFDM